MSKPLPNRMRRGRAARWAGNLAGAGAAWAALGLAAVLTGLPGAAALGADAEADQPKSARELYNEGTQKLREGKLSEAELNLQDAVARQDGRVQPEALFNLGDARFVDGKKELEDGPEPAPLRDASTRASESAQAALRAADEALAGQDLQPIVEAYLRGRGARRDLKGALDAVKRAMEIYNSALTKWRRAAGDFKSAAELQPTNRDAQVNGDLADRYIARLVDQVRLMAALRDGMGQQRQKLRQRMTKLKEKMPSETGQKMAGDDGDDDEGDGGDTQPKELKSGQEEGPVKTGSQMQLTREEAKRLLGLLRLDAERRLLLGGSEETAKPKDRKGRDW